MGEKGVMLEDIAHTTLPRRHMHNGADAMLTEEGTVIQDNLTAIRGD